MGSDLVVGDKDELGGEIKTNRIAMGVFDNIFVYFLLGECAHSLCFESDEEFGRCKPLAHEDLDRFDEQRSRKTWEEIYS